MEYAGMTMKIFQDVRFPTRLVGGLFTAAFAMLCGVGAHGQTAARTAPPKTVGAADAPHGEIVWDTYGVPHVFAKNTTGLFWGFGYAQMQGHGDLLLRLYGESRGRAAEYWGAKYAPLDRYLAAFDASARAEDWYKQQTPAMKANLDAFAAGITAYGKQHPEKLADDVKVVLPVSGVDVVAHWERVMEFQYIASMAKATGRGIGAAAVELGENELPSDVQIAKLEQLDELEQDAGGSNAWAVAPSKTVDGHAMLLANPHLDWPPSYQTYFEAQLNCAGVCDVRSDAGGAAGAAIQLQRGPRADQHGELDHSGDYLQANDDEDAGWQRWVHAGRQDKGVRKRPEDDQDQAGRWVVERRGCADARLGVWAGICARGWDNNCATRGGIGPAVRDTGVLGPGQCAWADGICRGAEASADPDVQHSLCRQGWAHPGPVQRDGPGADARGFCVLVGDGAGRHQRESLDEAASLRGPAADSRPSGGLGAEHQQLSLDQHGAADSRSGKVPCVHVSCGRDDVPVGAVDAFARGCAEADV